jgi:hypothetical protein
VISVGHKLTVKKLISKEVELKNRKNISSCGLSQKRNVKASPHLAPPPGVEIDPFHNNIRKKPFHLSIHK